MSESAPAQVAGNAGHEVSYLGTFLWLVGLLALSAVATLLPLSSTATAVIIYAAAAAKAVFVIANFMHVRFEPRLVRIIGLSPVLLFVILLVSLIPDIVTVFGAEV